MSSEAKSFPKLSQFLSTIKNCTKGLLQHQPLPFSTLSNGKTSDESWQTVACFSDMFENVQGEKDPIVVQALNFSYALLQDLALGRCAPPDVKDDTAYVTLKHNVMEFLKTFSDALLKNTEELDLPSEVQFEAVANELFELNTNEDESTNPKMTWGRIVSLFSFAVCMAEKYQEDADKVETVSWYLAKSILKYGLPFIRASGGWEDILNELPAEAKESTNSEEILKKFGLQNMFFWSGLCVGSVATTMFLLCRK